MTPEGHNELFPAIEAALKEPRNPSTATSSMRSPSIRASAPLVNRVSDYLGVLFRKGKVTRTQANSPGVRTRWAYVWHRKPLPDWRGPEPVGFRPKALVDKPNLYVAEDGEFLNIELPNFTITIRTKRPA